MRRHRLDDVARLLTCSIVATVRLHSLLTWRVVVVGGSRAIVVGGGGETVAGGGGGDEAGDDGGREAKSMVCLRRTYEFPANAAHALS